TTPYTSYLVVPDAPMPVALGTVLGREGRVNGAGFGLPTSAPAGLAGPGGATKPTYEFAKENQRKPGELADKRGKLAESELRKAGKDGKGEGQVAAQRALGQKAAYDRAHDAFRGGAFESTQREKLGVDLSLQTQNLRNQCRLEYTAQRSVQGRNCLELAGV